MWYDRVSVYEIVLYYGWYVVILVIVLCGDWVIIRGWGCLEKIMEKYYVGKLLIGV